MMRPVFSTLPVDNPPGSDFRAKHKKSKNVSSACGNPWKTQDLRPVVSLEDYSQLFAIFLPMRLRSFRIFHETKNDPFLLIARISFTLSHYIQLYPTISHYIPLYPTISHYIQLYPTLSTIQELHTYDTLSSTPQHLKK